MTDTLESRRAAAMVRSLGALDPRIARAMEAVPRHRFVPPELRSSAYEDEPVPLRESGSTVSAPHMVAIQLEAADLAPGLSVLEVGSGSGYLLALIAELVGPSGRVLGIEIEPSLVVTSRETLRSLGYGATVSVRAGDGIEGAPDLAPFDRILVSCAVGEIAPAWRAQLAPDGRIVAPLGGPFRHRLVTVDREGRRLQNGPECRFVPLRGPRDPIYRPAI